MKLSTILVGTLAAFTTAIAVPFIRESTIERGLDFSSGLVEKTNIFPGVEEAKALVLCIWKDKTWKAD